MHPLLLDIFLAEPKVNFCVIKGSCEKKKQTTTSPNKARSEDLPLLLALLQAQVFLSRTCATLQVCHRYVNAWSCTLSTLTLSLTFRRGFLACRVITDLDLTLNFVSGPDPDLDLLTYLSDSSSLLCPSLFTFSS